MPAVPDLETLAAVVRGFRLEDLLLVVESDAAVAVRASLDTSGLLLLGEVHGVRENPQILFALMCEFGIGGLALEWSASAAGSVAAWRGGGTLPHDDDLWWGDGRVTAGHYALLRARLGAAEPALTLFDVAVLPEGATWSDRDAAMAATVLRAPATDGGWLVVAGNAHTLLTATDLGEPLGLHVAKVRAGVRSIEVRYQSGGFYNNGPRRFALYNAGRSRFPSIAPRGSARLHLDHGRLVLDVAEAHEADVPHRAAPIQ